jgi:ABC-type uncharacterized transport system ATPase subunit
LVGAFFNGEGEKNLPFWCPMAAACPMIADKVIAACRLTDAPKAAVVTERSALLLSIGGFPMHFGGIVALDNVSFDVKARQICGLIGPNGAKTTLPQLSILLVEHHMSLVMQVSDQVVAFDFGRKIAYGTQAAVRKSPDFIRSCLGGKL